MNEETLDVIVTGVAFALALYAWARRNAVVSLANETMGRENFTDAS